MSPGTYSTSGGLGVNQPAPTSASTLRAPFVHGGCTVPPHTHRATPENFWRSPAGVVPSNDTGIPASASKHWGTAFNSAYSKS